MLVDATQLKVLSDTPPLNRWGNARFNLTWRGFFFVPGHKSGADSAETFVRTAFSEGLGRALINTYGHFFAVLDDLESGTRRAFVDSGGLFKAYVWEGTVSTSYLELLARANLSLSDLDPESVVEFLQFGMLFGDHTLTPTIHKLSQGDVLVLNEGEPRFEHLVIPPLGDRDAPRITLPDLLRAFAESASAERVSLDLTGGLDTRLLATGLDHLGFPFEVALSGSPQTVESRLAAVVAEHLGRPLHLLTVDPGDTDLADALDFADGSMDALEAHYVTRYQADRSQRGVSLVVGGIGAPLFRDEWWYQDFPFLRRARSNVARLYDLRLSPLPLPTEILAERFAEAGGTLRNRMLVRMEGLVQPTNTETYDMVYHEFVTRQRMATTIARIAATHHGVYAPFAEPSALRIGYTLPRLQRMMLRFHRKTITAANPAVARLMTTEQMTASSEPLPFALDVVRYTANKTKRLAKKIGQRLLSRTFFQPMLRDASWESSVMETPEAGRLVAGLVSAGVLREGITSEQVPARLRGRVLTLGHVVEQLYAANGAG